VILRAKVHAGRAAGKTVSGGADRRVSNSCATTSADLAANSTVEFNGLRRIAWGLSCYPRYLLGVGMERAREELACAAGPFPARRREIRGRYCLTNSSNVPFMFLWHRKYSRGGRIPNIGSEVLVWKEWPMSSMRT